jgi:predicted permease
MREIRIPGIRRVLRVSWSDSALRQEVTDEIRFHLDTRTEELIAAGLTPREARDRAEAEYGDVQASAGELVQVDRRRQGHARREDLVQSFVEDVTFAARSLARRPGLLAVTTVVLAIGIAANAVMFGVVDQLLLRPPAGIAGPERVRRIFYHDVGKGHEQTSFVTTYAVVAALRRSAPAFSEVAAFAFRSDWSLGTGREARDVKVRPVSGNYFRLLGVQPELGRLFTDDDDRIPQGEQVAVVSYDFWHAWGEPPEVAGRTLRLQGKVFTIVGVAPKGFAGTERERVDIWVPIAAVAAEAYGSHWYDQPASWWLQVVGRLRAGVTPAVAAAQATAAYRGFIREWKDPIRDSTSSVVLSTLLVDRSPLGLSTVGRVSLWLMAVSVIVLLIACANVANLLIARTVQRRREIAVRLALGVSRGRLVRLLLTEAGLLAATGAAVAVALTWAAGRLVQHVLLPSIVWREQVFDGRVLGFTLLATVCCILLAGAAPALEGLGTQVSEALKAGAHQVAGGRGRVRFALLALQAALSVVLLIGAGLFVASLRNVVTHDAGLDRDRVLQVTMPLTRFGFDSNRAVALYREASERARAVPGVVSASLVWLSVPMGTLNATRFAVPGVERPELEAGGPYNAVVGADFFPTVGAPVLRGRNFTAAEERSPSRVAIVNQTLARAYWPGSDPLGQCVILFSDSTCSEVVGVAHDVMQFRIIGEDRAIVYVPRGHPAAPPGPPGALLVRVAKGPAAVIPPLRQALQQLDPGMPYVRIAPYTELVAFQLQPWRLGATMFTLFGIIALVIAAVGLYSVMSFWVSQRTQEVGIRMALGAQRGDVVRLLAWQSSRAVLLGLVLGAAAAALAARWLAPLLYDTSPRDPWIYGGAALVLALASVAAGVIPARRSVAIDPTQAIRSE